MDIALTPKEVAAELSCHPVTIRKLCQGGKLRAYKIGSQWRIKREDLERLRTEEA